MLGFEPRCQPVRGEVSRDSLEDLRGGKQACLFLIIPSFFFLHTVLHTGSDWLFYLFFCLFLDLSLYVNKDESVRLNYKLRCAY